ncbi:hypothetical protein HD806DRAFT_462184 [Xylariaceae sp. AK1471]|nr:hypothetical protein HD806DRAFT_462184 [Xylariaceae sp. AK1471]
MTLKRDDRSSNKPHPPCSSHNSSIYSTLTMTITMTMTTPMTSRLLTRPAHTFKVAAITRHITTATTPPSRNHPVRIANRSFPIPHQHQRQLSNTNNPPLLKISSKNLPPRPKPPPEHEIEEAFLKGSGPGGQKINKTNSAVQLKHLPTGLVVKCQATRSRSQNRTIARQLLADKLDNMARGDGSRSSIVGEVKRKKRASSAKKSRRKYRKLDDEKAGATGQMLDDENSNFGAEELPEEENDIDRDDGNKETLDRRQQEARI